MCGIAGFYAKDEIFTKEDLAKITGALSHRGPDAEGFFFNGKVGLGHRRLSIIDLSEEANQPMWSLSGRYAIIYNGEVYNFKELAAELNVDLRTTSDTEVVLQAFEKWGERFVEKLNGMFALALLDKETNELWLYRDRMGIKPLFYFWDGKQFAFASEIKSLLRLDLVNQSKNINKRALTAYLHLGYVPEPDTFYANIHKFPAGQFLKIAGSKLKWSRYWDLSEQFTKDTITDIEEAKHQLKELLTSSVQYRMISDVPFGTFLSGGTDSSLVTAIAQSLSNKPVNTFTIGFRESKYNEAKFAKEIAGYLGTDHHEFILSHQDAIDLFDEVLDVYDEPIADSSTVPTLLISKMARQQVKMILSGDGGDETFMGYGFYKWARRLNQPFLKFARRPIAKVLATMPSRYERVAKLMEYKDTASSHLRSHVFSQEQYYFSEEEIAELLHPQFYQPFEIKSHNGLARKLDDAEMQALFDLEYYLKDDLLVKVDRASMHHSLEVRVPLLDHRLVAYAVNIHPDLKLRGDTYKFLLKKVLYDYIPEKFFDRPKWGFGMPISLWLKKELKYLINDYLNETVLEKAGLVRVSYVENLVSQFNKGKDYLYNRIWQLIVLHRWYIEKY